MDHNSTSGNSSYVSFLWNPTPPLHSKWPSRGFHWYGYFVTLALGELLLTVYVNHFKFDNGVMVTSKTSFHFIIFIFTCLCVAKLRVTKKHQIPKGWVLKNRVICLGVRQPFHPSICSNYDYLEHWKRPASEIPKVGVESDQYWFFHW